MSDRSFTFFHAPNTRSSCILRLIVEIGVPHHLHLLSLEKRDHKTPAYLAVNPLGKVPAIRHGDTVVTEQGAIALYLGDLFPETGMCPQMGDPLRGGAAALAVLLRRRRRAGGAAEGDEVAGSAGEHRRLRLL